METAPDTDQQVFKDHDVLTILMKFMVKDAYPPFLETSIYQQLYADNKPYRATIPLKKKDETLILSLGKEYYQWKSNQTQQEE